MSTPSWEPSRSENSEMTNTDFDETQATSAEKTSSASGVPVSFLQDLGIFIRESLKTGFTELQTTIGEGLRTRLADVPAVCEAALQANMQNQETITQMHTLISEMSHNVSQVRYYFEEWNRRTYGVIPESPSPQNQGLNELQSDTNTQEVVENRMDCETATSVQHEQMRRRLTRENSRINMDTTKLEYESETEKITRKRRLSSRSTSSDSRTYRTTPSDFESISRNLNLSKSDRKHRKRRREPSRTRHFSRSPAYQRSRKSYKTKSCFFCDHDHRSKHCTTIKNPTRRREVAERSGMCLNCFKHRVHDGKPCYDPIAKCSKCKGQHLKMFCPN